MVHAQGVRDSLHVPMLVKCHATIDAILLTGIPVGTQPRGKPTVYMAHQCNVNKAKAVDV